MAGENHASDCNIWVGERCNCVTATEPDLYPYEDEAIADLDLEFPPRKPAVSAMRRKQASTVERAEQASDDKNEGPLWRLDGSDLGRAS